LTNLQKLKKIKSWKEQLQQTCEKWKKEAAIKLKHGQNAIACELVKSFKV
jgi:hypothetical protein